MNEPRFVAEILKSTTIYGESIVVIIDKTGIKNPQLHSFHQTSDPKQILEGVGYEYGNNIKYIDHQEA